MPLSPGDTLGPYEILAQLGAGGMGEVYRARDSRLNRDVAIKVSNERFSDRFEREAHAVAALNHPNICTLYDIGPNYLVMEVIEGESPKGPLPLQEVLRIAHQIADALDAAHEKGIIHRDLKPGNIKIKPDGTAKVLDFGLAKTVEPTSGDPESSPTLTVSPTRAGMILGTAAYMSPEQARGKTVDKRADIWAFGVVLYELLTGLRPFQGEDLSETLASVMKDKPDMSRVPFPVRRLLESCLEKDPKKRLRDIGDAWRLLEEPVIAPAAVKGASRWAWAVAAGATLALAVLGTIHFHETAPESALARFTILPPPNTTLGTSSGIAVARTSLALAPDGRTIVFNAVSADGTSRLWIRPLDSVSVQPLAGTEGAAHPFWSPDSRQLGFWAGGKLKKIDPRGGPPIALCDAGDMRGGTWNKDGVIVFAPEHSTPLFRVSASGGDCSQLTKLETTGGVAHRYPWFLPDGRHFVFMVSPVRQEPDQVTIWVGSLDSPESKKILEANSNAVYSQGHLLFLREDTLFAQRFDLRRLATEGEAVPVAAGVRRAITAARGIFSVSEKGQLVYQIGAVGMRQLVWFDRAGNRLSTVGEPGRFESLDFAPDRRSFAMSVTEQSKTDIWVYDTASGRRTRFTFDPAVKRDAIWSPDGRSIAFSSNRNGHFDLYRKPSDGSGAEELLYADGHDIEPTSWSPDGKLILYRSTPDPKTDANLWVLRLVPDQTGSAMTAFPLAQNAQGSNAQFSPDGRWIAYQSNESGRAEIYLTPFRGQGSTAAWKIQVSTAGGFVPRWRPNGEELFFVAPDGVFMVAEVKAKGDAVQTSEMHSLGRIVITNGRFYDVSPDGQRFLVSLPLERLEEPLTFVENWNISLKKGSS